MQPSSAPAKLFGNCSSRHWSTSWRATGSFPRSPANRPGRARRSGPSTATSRPTSRWRWRKAAGKHAARGRRGDRRAACRLGGDSPLAEATIAGPGFINLRLSPAFWQAALPAILAAGRRLGPGRAAPRRRRSCSSTCRRTRPGRSPSRTGAHAAVGDSLTRAAALRRLSGDARVLHQRRRQPGADAGAVGLGPLHGGGARRRSRRCPRSAFPENGYKGDYIRDFGRDALRARRQALGRARAARRHRADPAVRDRAARWG